MAWQALAAAAISGAADLIGGSSANSQRRKEAQRNRDFQERMSSTAHQREIKDLRAAGLNPILSATGGKGASTPGGSMAQQENIAKSAVNSALSAARLNQELKNLKSTQKNIDANTQKTIIDSETSLANARTAHNQSQMSINDKYRSDREWEMYNAIYQGDLGLALYGLNQGRGTINSAAGAARAAAAIMKGGTRKVIPALRGRRLRTTQRIPMAN